MSIDTYPSPNLASASTVLAFIPVSPLSFATALASTPLPGFSTSVFVRPGRTIRVSVRCYVMNNTLDARSQLFINEDSVQKQAGFVHHSTTGINTTIEAEVVLYPTPGVHVYTINAGAQAGTATFGGTENYLAYLLVEDITGGTGGPGPISLGLKENFGNTQAITGSLTAIAGSQVTVDVPAGRRLRVSGKSHITIGSVSARVQLAVMEGGTILNQQWQGLVSANVGEDIATEAIIHPSPGQHTYQLGIAGNLTGGSIYTTGTIYNFIHVEDVTGTEAPTGAYYEAQWTPVTVFTNSWVNYGVTYTPAAYRKVNDLVYLRGLIKNGTISTPAFNLPVGYRPAWDHHFTALSNSILAGVRVFQDGRVTPGDPGSNLWIALDGIVFGVT